MYWEVVSVEVMHSQVLEYSKLSRQKVTECMSV